mmetsp:Transcript_13177/g.25142  ORF Transcript_13177/g.25142 Transcript_13177/m.25142 type:complete len:357 (+) Transcript_13177:557-1627(+)|eukprot:CAMPEP_0114224614 /NCGR_PEP_ID=MMETSP0058-20121206/206_1 /TAXON_ID=36894 /ORGANISM="Pyramimonas parkeae, CCMP726" /LENGTH=356 /DNA_ID=CAMNT_0001335111 /DNA_START=516 /DNA_END=1586 /DNA_ORIENTATION=-
MIGATAHRHLKFTPKHAMVDDSYTFSRLCGTLTTKVVLGTLVKYCTTGIVSQSDNIWHPGVATPRASLEVPRIGERPSVRALLSGGSFGAAVTVDFPDPGRFIRKSPNDGNRFVGEEGPPNNLLPEVSTTAACRWGAPTGDLALRLRERVRAGDRALLLCGGDQSRWRNPDPKFPDVFQLYHTAREVLREFHDPPPIWCTSNCLAEDPSREAARTVQKLEAGATVIVTRPAGMLVQRAEKYWAALARAGVTGVPILVTISVPPGRIAVENWLKMCGVSHSSSEAQQLLQRWQQAATQGTTAFRRFRLSQIQESIEFAKSLSGFAGVHVVPVDDRGVCDLEAYLHVRRTSHPNQPIV